jgi:EAL domain-containing protein (putative c-di-GMP-specific phosphodiesterase class I)
MHRIPGHPSDDVPRDLQIIGVDYAQGFGIGRPEPLEDALARLG